MIEDDSHIVVLDWNKVSNVEISSHGHIHGLDGRCMKRRQGPKCESKHKLTWLIRKWRRSL